jgi:hypothetical protein
MYVEATRVLPALRRDMTTLCDADVSSEQPSKADTTATTTCSGNSVDQAGSSEGGAAAGGSEGASSPGDTTLLTVRACAYHDIFVQVRGGGVWCMPCMKYNHSVGALDSSHDADATVGVSVEGSIQLGGGGQLDGLIFGFA